MQGMVSALLMYMCARRGRWVVVAGAGKTRPCGSGQLEAQARFQSRQRALGTTTSSQARVAARRQGSASGTEATHLGVGMLPSGAGGYQVRTYLGTQVPR